MSQAVLEILLRARDEASPALARTQQQLANLNNEFVRGSSQAGQFSGSLSQVSRAAAIIDQSGRQARIGLLSAAQAAELFGVNIQRTIVPMAGMADAIGDIVGAAGALGGAGLAFTALTAAIGLMAQKIMEVQRAHEEFNNSLNAIRERARELQLAISEIGTSYSELSRKISSLSGVSVAMADSWVRAAEKSDEIKTALQDFVRISADMEAVGKRIEFLRGQLAQAEGFGRGAAYAATLRQEITKLESQLTTLTAQLTAARDQLNVLSSGAQVADSAMGHLNSSVTMFGATAQSASRHTSDLADQLMLLAGRINAAALMKEAIQTVDGWMIRLGVSTSATEEIMRRGRDAAAALQERMKKLATEGVNAAAAAMSRLRDTLRGLIEQALQPTTVAERMQMLGDAWDEFRLRLEAVATGTAPEQFGEKFVQQFNALGMSAAQAAEAFRNFSLFADPRNLSLVNWGPIVASVEQQLLSMAGKANLVNEAMRQVWSNLSPTAKAALAAQGIEDVNAAILALTDPAARAQQEVQGLGQAIQAIPRAVSTIFTADDKSARETIEAFKEYLDKFMQDYGAINIQIEAEANAPNIPSFQFGGIMPYTGLALLHAGERVIPAAHVAAHGVTASPDKFIPPWEEHIIPVTHYHNTNDIRISNNTFVIRSDRDIESLARWIARYVGKHSALRG